MRGRLTAAAILICASAPPAQAVEAFVFGGACDGSAAVVIEGSLLVANDEDNTLRTYSMAGGVPTGAVAFDAKLAVTKEVDIEAAARLGDRVFWIGSHGRSREEGKPRPDRARLFATTVTAPVTLSGRFRDDLLVHALADRALSSLDLATAAGLPPEVDDGLNIEGLAAGPDGSLLIAFRNPLRAIADATSETALLLPLLNPAQVIDEGATPLFGAPVALDLVGQGVRDILRTSTGDYVVLAGPTGATGAFAAYRWSGRSGDRPRPVAADLAGLRPEAVAEVDGRFLVLSDDGDDACKATPAAQQSFRGRLIDIAP